MSRSSGAVLRASRAHPVSSERAHQCGAGPAIRVAVGVDYALVDARGRLDFGVGVDGEKVGEPVFLLVGEPVGTGVQGA